MLFRTLRAEELDRWADHCFSVFTGDSREYFLAHYANDPWRDLNGIFVAEDKGRIVATVRVFRRRVWLFGREIGMGGIGEVSTKNEYRGQGLAGTLLKMAAQWMAAEGMPVSLLFASKFDFYRKFGWECIPKPVSSYARASGPPCAGWAMEPGDMKSLAEVDAAAVKTNWSVVRTDPAYWETWMKAAIGKCVVATHGGRIVAWMAYSLQEDGWAVEEFKALPGYEDRFDGLCALAAAAEGRSVQPFRAPAWLPTNNMATGDTAHMYSMVRLNTAFDAGGRTLETTRQLIEETAECRDSSLDHF